MKNFFRKLSLVLVIFLSSFAITQAAINIVPNGGTGVGTLTSGECLRGNGTNPITTSPCNSFITGTDTRVLFFDGANNPAGDAGFTYNKTTDSATLAGDLKSNSYSQLNPTGSKTFTITHNASNGGQVELNDGNGNYINMYTNLGAINICGASGGCFYMFSDGSSAVYASTNGANWFVSGPSGEAKGVSSGGTTISLTDNQIDLYTASSGSGLAVHDGDGKLTLTNQSGTTLILDGANTIVSGNLRIGEFGSPRLEIWNPSAGDWTNYLTGADDTIVASNDFQINGGLVVSSTGENITLDNTSTNSVDTASIFNHTTSGTATTGFGISHLFQLENASGTLKNAATNEFSWSDATNASEDTTYNLKLMRAGTLTTALTINSLGMMTPASDITLSTHNLITDTTTGTKIGTGTTQKLGFFNSTPIVQPTGNVITALTNLGLVGSPTIPGRLASIQVLTTTGAGTYTTPAGITAIDVMCVAGGGGGGGVLGAVGQDAAAASGGGGGWARKYITSPSATYSYVIGTGGAGGASGNNAGTDGADTTFNAGSITTKGGKGGAAGTNMLTSTKAGSAGGAVSTGGDTNGGGQASGWSLAINTASGTSGPGGSSIFGGGALGVVATATAVAGNNASNYGAGGSGAAVNGNANAAGGNGSQGICQVYEYN